MEYYTREGKKFEIDSYDSEYEFLGEGSCGKVVRYNDMLAFKEYFEYVPDGYRLQTDVYDILREIDSDALVKLGEIYTLNQDGEFRTDAYMMEYFEKDSEPIIMKDKEYVLDNISKLEKLVTLLSNRGVLLIDLNIVNFALSTKGFKIYDFDGFCLPDIGNDKIKLLNWERLLLLLKMMFKRSIIYESDIYEYQSKLEELFSRVEVADDISLVLGEKLQRVRRPIDYFR